MPPRNDELPEGTDHIINGAMETDGAGTDGTRGAGATGGGGASSGFIGTNTGNDSADAAGSSSAAGEGPGHGGSNRSGARDGPGHGGSNISRGGGGGEESSGGVGEQLRSQVYALRDQGVSKARDYADTGKTRATDMLEELSRVVADTADSIDERLGNNYGEYARRAADSVSSLADSLRTKDVDELYGNVRDAVRKSPGVAVGIAAVVGFTLARLVKAGLEGGEADDRRNDGTGAGGTGGSGGTGA